MDNIEKIIKENYKKYKELTEEKEKEEKAKKVIKEKIEAYDEKIRDFINNNFTGYGEVIKTKEKTEPAPEEKEKLKQLETLEEKAIAERKNRDAADYKIDFIMDQLYIVKKNFIKIVFYFLDTEAKKSIKKNLISKTGSIKNAGEKTLKKIAEELQEEANAIGLNIRIYCSYIVKDKMEFIIVFDDISIYNCNYYRYFSSLEEWINRSENNDEIINVDELENIVKHDTSTSDELKKKYDELIKTIENFNSSLSKKYYNIDDYNKTSLYINLKHW